ncbi:MAG: hypothetical protein AAF708_16185 [Deinococcota bacterium]
MPIMTVLDTLLALVSLVGLGLLTGGLAVIFVLQIPVFRQRYPAAMPVGLRTLLVGVALVAVTGFLVNQRGAALRVANKYILKEVINASSL